MALNPFGGRPDTSKFSLHIARETHVDRNGIAMDAHHREVLHLHRGLLVKTILLSLAQYPWPPAFSMQEMTKGTRRGLHLKTSFWRMITIAALVGTLVLA
jgi:hypothetical protein